MLRSSGGGLKRKNRISAPAVRSLQTHSSEGVSAFTPPEFDDAVSVFTSSFHCRAAGRWLASRASRPAEKPGIEQQEADIYISGLRARDGSSEGGHTFIHRAKGAEDVT